MRRVVKHLSSLKAVKEIDAFPKVQQEFTETTTLGGTVSILGSILIIALIISEVMYFSKTQLKFEYEVDTDYDSKIKINIDMTVAMPCDSIGADILDVTHQSSETYGELKEEPAFFELTPTQRIHWSTMHDVNKYIRAEYHAVHEIMWKEGYTNIWGMPPEPEARPLSMHDSCKLSGSLVVNKVAGNFHITAGKHIPHPVGHAHVSLFLSGKDYNYSHRIEKFSFGEPSQGVFDPLEGEEKVTKTNYQLYQYYIQIVPTDIISPFSRISTYQYSVTEQERPIDHDKGSHGVPGIYFKYQLSSVKVKIYKLHPPLGRFLVRLCAMVGGVHVTIGLLTRGLKALFEKFQSTKKEPLLLEEED